MGVEAEFFPRPAVGYFMGVMITVFLLISYWPGMIRLIPRLLGYAELLPQIPAAPKPLFFAAAFGLSPSRPRRVVVTCDLYDPGTR